MHLHHLYALNFCNYVCLLVRKSTKSFIIKSGSDDALQLEAARCRTIVVLGFNDEPHNAPVYKFNYCAAPQTDNAAAHQIST